MRGLKKSLTEPAAELRALEAKPLDRLLVSLWPQALRGRPEAVDRVLRIMERRARLLGLDTPPRLELALQDHGHRLVKTILPVLLRHFGLAGFGVEQVQQVAREIEEACSSAANQ